MTLRLPDETVAVALCAEAAALAERGDATAALARYEQAVNAAPALLPLHLILANAQQLNGDTLGARATLRRALRVAARPDAAAAFTLGKALVDAGAGADAVPCFRHARAEHPHNAAAAAALASALRDAQQPDMAWREVRHALRLAPDDPVALLTAALVRHDLADYAGALDWCERSLAVRPDSASARMTRGYLRHLLGDEAGSWADFEARALPKPMTPVVPWRGELLDGRTLLVIGEQGVGDQFQCLRFVHHPAVQSAARVVIACHRDAVSLLRASGYDAVARDEPVSADYFVPLLSLPLLLDVGSTWRGAGDVYLRLPDVASSTDCLANVWSDPRRTHKRRVGVVWAGNPTHRNDAVRSIPAAVLAGLSQSHPDMHFVCMQHGADDADMPSCGWERVPSGDWLETARQLCTLDVLLTVDTGIAHLAGALGVPVWIMVPFVPDWRWGAVGGTTPWYSSARLFRQPSRGNWARVVTNVSAALSAFDPERTAKQVGAVPVLR
jgi:tetratricopeptide (TPR) repeat protein